MTPWGDCSLPMMARMRLADSANMKISAAAFERNTTSAMTSITLLRVLPGADRCCTCRRIAPAARCRTHLCARAAQADANYSPGLRLGPARAASILSSIATNRGQVGEHHAQRRQAQSSRQDLQRQLPQASAGTSQGEWHGQRAPAWSRTQVVDARHLTAGTSPDET